MEISVEETKLEMTSLNRESSSIRRSLNREQTVQPMLAAVIVKVIVIVCPWSSKFLHPDAIERLD